MICIGCIQLSDLDEPTDQQLYALASPKRRQQAERCLRKEDAQRCILAEGLLRYVLRKVLGTDQVELSQNKAGKPCLAHRDDLHFNLSHSGKHVVIAWSEHPVGIDVEWVRMDESKERLAHRFFHPEEQAFLFEAQGQERAYRFFEIWTKKESYLKFLGTGIDRNLNSFNVFDLPHVAFYSRRLEDAVLTICSTDADCQIISLTPKMLLPE